MMQASFLAENLKPPHAMAFFQCGFTFDIEPTAIDFVPKIPNPCSVILSFQLNHFPPILLNVVDQPHQKSILGGSRFVFPSGVTSSFDFHESELKQLLSSNDKALSIMVLNSGGYGQGEGHQQNMATLVGSATVDLSSFTNERSFCSIWGSIKRHVTIYTPQQKVVASLEVSLSLYNSGPLLRSRHLTTANEIARSSAKAGFCLEMNVDRIETSGEFFGPYPDIGIQIYNFPVTILPCPTSLRQRDARQNETVKYDVSRLLAFDVAPEELKNVLTSQNHVVMVFQERSEELKKLSPLSKNHALLRGTSTIELSRLMSNADDDLNSAKGIWGDFYAATTITNPKGTTLGRVHYRMKLFCGGSSVTSEEADKGELGSSKKKKLGEEAGHLMAHAPSPTQADMGNRVREDWVQKFGAGTLERRNWEGDSLIVDVENSNVGTSAISTMSGMTTTKSQTFSKNAFVGRGKGLGGVLAPPMQGAGAPKSANSRRNGHKHEDSVLFTPHQSFDEFGFDESAGKSLKRRALVSMTLSGDVESIAANTKPRQQYEKQFFKDISSCLQIQSSRLVINRIRSGSIIVDFTIEDGDDDSDDDCVECVKNLKKQLMDPSSVLLEGAVTRDCLKLISEIEIYDVLNQRAESANDRDDRASVSVSRSGTFQFSAPHEDICNMFVPGRGAREITGGNANDIGSNSNKDIMTTQVTNELPVAIGGGRRGGGRHRSKHGERDIPGLLYYYPGVEKEVAEAEREKQKSLFVPTKEGTTLVERSGASPKESGVRLGEEEEEEEEVFRLSKNSPVSNKIAGEKVGSQKMYGGSVLAKILGEMKEGNADSNVETSTLARLFVEMMAVQRNAMKRAVEKNKKPKKSKKSKIKERKEKKRTTKSLSVDVENEDPQKKPPPPLISPRAEQSLKDFFDANSNSQGRVNARKLISHMVKIGNVSAEDLGEPAEDATISWEDLMMVAGTPGKTWVGSKVKAVEEAFPLQEEEEEEEKEENRYSDESDEDENGETLVNFGTITKSDVENYHDMNE